MDTKHASPETVGHVIDSWRPVRVLIVSEVRLLCEGLAELLPREKSISVLGASGDLEGAISMSCALQPDVILLDAAFEHGLAAVAQLRDAVPGIRVVALAIAETEEEVILWAKAGVAGYVPRTTALADLVQLLVDINNRRQPCSSRVAFGLLQRVAEADSRGNARDEPRCASPLTSRESQISKLISEGLSNKEIARRLNIGLSTAKSHVHNLLRKLNIQRRGQVAAWSREHKPPTDALAPNRLRV